MRPLALLTAVGVESTAGAFPHLLALHMTASALLGHRPSAGQRRSIRTHEPRLQPNTVGRQIFQQLLHRIIEM